MSILLAFIVNVNVYCSSAASLLPSDDLPIKSKIAIIKVIKSTCDINTNRYINCMYSKIFDIGSDRYADINVLLSNPAVLTPNACVLYLKWTVARGGSINNCMSKLYELRAIWWRDRNSKVDINSILADQFSMFRTLRYDRIPQDQLSEYCTMLYCISCTGNRMHYSFLKELLKDKRIVIDYSFSQLIGHETPCPSRVCDHAFMAMLSIYQVDVSSFSRLYGYPFLFTRQPGMSTQKQVEAKFDTMISNIVSIERQYFR